MTCPNCGAAVADNRRFCGKCGTALAPRPRPADRPRPPPRRRTPAPAAARLRPRSWGAADRRGAPPPAARAAAAARRRRRSVRAAQPRAAAGLRAARYPPPGYPPPRYPPPGYPPPPGTRRRVRPGGASGAWPGYGTRPPHTNGLAIASLVLGLVGWIALRRRLGARDRARLRRPRPDQAVVGPPDRQRAWPPPGSSSASSAPRSGCSSSSSSLVQQQQLRRPPATRLRIGGVRLEDLAGRPADTRPGDDADRSDPRDRRRVAPSRVERQSAAARRASRDRPAHGASCTRSSRAARRSGRDADRRSAAAAAKLQVVTANVDACNPVPPPGHRGRARRARRPPHAKSRRDASSAASSTPPTATMRRLTGEA